MSTINNISVKSPIGYEKLKKDIKND